MITSVKRISLHSITTLPRRILSSARVRRNGVQLHMGVARHLSTQFTFETIHSVLSKNSYLFAPTVQNHTVFMVVLAEAQVITDGLNSMDLLTYPLAALSFQGCSIN